MSCPPPPSHLIQVVARAQRKEGGNVKNMTTSKELRQGKEGGPPLLPLWLKPV